jgi:hypothetical protein
VSWESYCIAFTAFASFLAILQRFLQWYEARKHRKEEE